MEIFRESTKINDNICKEVIRSYLQFDKKHLSFLLMKRAL